MRNAAAFTHFLDIEGMRKGQKDGHLAFDVECVSRLVDEGSCEMQA